MNRTDQLISDYFDGQLDPAGAKELADLLLQDKVLREDFIELYRQHQLLTDQSTASDLSLIERVLADLRSENKDFALGVLEEYQRADEDESALQFKPPRRLRLPKNQTAWWRLFWPLSTGRLLTITASVLLIAVGFFIVSRNGSISAITTKVSAGVKVIRSGRSLVCYEGFPLKVGDMVQTPTNGTVEVQYLGERTFLHLLPGTQLRFQNPTHGKHLNLTAGEIVVVAGHQPPNAPMILATSQAQARVVGTRFRLAARSFSTWLEVHEGAVAFKRNSPGNTGQGLAGSEGNPEQVLVKTGEYAVAADGIPLETYPVTDQQNLDHPLPIKIGWFSLYGESDWYVHPPYVTEVQPVSTSRTFQLPATKGSILVAGSVTVNSVKPGLAFGNEGAGFGLGMSAGSDYYAACVQVKNGQPVLEIVDLSRVPLNNGQPILPITDNEIVSLAEAPLPASSWPVCNVKFALKRERSQEAEICVKAWSGAEEPQGWQLSTSIKLHGLSDQFELRLMTIKSACTFANTSAYLVE